MRRIAALSLFRAVTVLLVTTGCGGRTASLDEIGDAAADSAPPGSKPSKRIVYRWF